MVREFFFPGAVFHIRNLALGGVLLAANFWGRLLNHETTDDTEVTDSEFLYPCYP